MARQAILAIDEGTTNCKAILVSENGEILASGSAPVPIAHPKSGWVEQSGEEIWAATCGAIAACLAGAQGIEIAGIGISSQRESVLIWDRRTGSPLGPVVSWQCRRTSAACAALREAGHEPEVIARTGLPLDPMFPPTKIRWLLDNHGGANGDICVGTIDSWLVWNLSGGTVHATDRSNAARTQLLNLSAAAWDADLCALFGIDVHMLPEIRDSSGLFGTTRGTPMLPDGLPIASAIGDSHAALFGHGAYRIGDGKVTFGTGSSVMATIGEFVVPPQGVTTTIAWSMGGTSTFALEGNILVSASILPWTAELLGFGSVEALMERAAEVGDAGGVTLVPGHVGLGAPHWNSEVRGLVSGLSFGTKPAHIARAAAESMGYQVLDVLDIMEPASESFGRLFVDGGPSRNRELMQIVADILNHPVTPCRNSEASALGAAYLAGLSTGFWADLDAISSLPRHDPDLVPAMAPTVREARVQRWRKAVAGAIAIV
ncbi:FGGY-family carbohydrate kinase [Fulvimarina sp. 2208YS6-2-32]|uniref:ATP:glycerol 3-phosphotransferase n=1 Tax=Fulvimarina uroteuthidis TaxID=3098149 RepID=A0ABU5I027_9HYPH|nr:FGGY-family carbohydrate kinase [Fulvimarina sp. 2208YS6-2-32]MDY8108739.1 FGGY-family carbohydrate kinase [Fulvimarina sp. 2208YS6-2-32]